MQKSSVDYSMITCFNMEIQTIQAQINNEAIAKNIATLNTVKQYLESRLEQLNKGTKV